MTTTPDSGSQTKFRHAAVGGSRQHRGKVLVGASIGHVLEWYDWVIYLVLSPFFAAQFFGSGDAVAAQLNSFAVFAVGFVVRPFGGLFFGWLADRRGRRASMTTAMLCTAGATLLIAAAPTYGSVGLLATVLLVIARMVQGFGLGGEVAGSYTYLAEMAPPRRRGLWSSSMYIAVTCGVTLATMLAAGLVTVLGEDALAEWGWRAPFVLGALLGFYALHLRRSLAESPSFHAASSPQPRSAPKMGRELWENKAAMLKVLALTIAPSVTYYVWSVSAPAFAISVKGIDAQQALWAGVAANLVFIAVLPLWGWVSDRWGRKPNLIFFSVGLALLMFPLDWVVRDEAWQLGLALSIALCVQAACASIGPALYAEQFPARVRATGFSLPYSIAVALFGGTAPYLQAFLSSRGMSAWFSGYVIALLVVAFATTLTLKETKGVDIE